MAIKGKKVTTNRDGQHCVGKREKDQASTPKKAADPSSVIQEVKGFASKFKLQPAQGRCPVTYQLGYTNQDDEEMPDKVYRYEDAILSRPFGSLTLLFTDAVHATIFRMPVIKTRLKLFNLLAWIFMLGGFFNTTLDGDMELLVNVNALIAGGLIFLLSPFIGRSVARWWTLRYDCVGTVQGNVHHFCMLAAALFPEPTPADRAARNLVRRYGVASHALLFKAARGDSDLGDLISAGVLQPREAKVLMKVSNKPHCVWGWLTRFWVMALDSDGRGTLACSRVPKELTNDIIGRCVSSRGAIGGAMTFWETQQPFAYVHLLLLMTEISVTLNTVLSGVSTGISIQGLVCGDGECDWIGNIGMVLALLIMNVFQISVPIVLLLGLYSLASMMQDPLGKDTMDFPELAFHYYLNNDTKNYAKAVDAINLADGWWEGLEAGENAAGMVAYQLEVTVVKARGLQKNDMFSASDPFVTVAVDPGGEPPEKATRVIENDETPMWNEKFVFHVSEKAAMVHITVFDHDEMDGNHDEIGDTSFNLWDKEEKPIRKVKGWFSVGEGNGEVYLDLKMTEIKQEVKKQPNHAAQERLRKGKLKTDRVMAICNKTSVNGLGKTQPKERLAEWKKKQQKEEAQSRKPEQAEETEQAASPKKQYCIAAYNFEAQMENHLGIEEGEKVEVLDEEGEWTRGRNADGQEGWFPTSFVTMQEPDPGNNGDVDDQTDDIVMAALKS